MVSDQERLWTGGVGLLEGCKSVGLGFPPGSEVSRSFVIDFIGPGFSSLCTGRVYMVPSNAAIIACPWLIIQQQKFARWALLASALGNYGHLYQGSCAGG